ncbi:hypothetical protein OAG71_03580, partial [bacterium]|nr:hypothetical protein [bacterium]
SMPTSLLGLSARMQAGKTTVSKAVALEMQALRISFGSVVADEAEKQRLDITREVLQDLGESMVRADVYGFCQRVLDSKGWRKGMSIVVDGVRHKKVLLALREMVEPDYFGLMYLNIDRETQLKRWKSEDIPYTKSLQELEQHSTEVEVLKVLPDFSDLILDGAKNVNLIVKKIVAWSESEGFIESWSERNERRIYLAKSLDDGSLSDDEQKEFELLQDSFSQYLLAKFDPYKQRENPHKVRLEQIQQKLKQERRGN